MNKNKLHFNADDAGISIGVNNAIAQMIKRKVLHSVSIFANETYTKEAISLCKKHPEIKTGLHFNVTVGQSISGHISLPLLTTPDNIFRYGFVGLCFATLIHRNKILKEIEKELHAQINYLEQNNLKLDHVNSHRHIHIIPGIFNTAYKTAKFYKIPNVRMINEKLLHTLLTTKNLSFILNGNLIKFIILKFFNSINSILCNISTKTYFFSILHTCNINNKLLGKFFIPKDFEYAEIMIHPGTSSLDRKDKSLKHEKQHLLAKNRDIEASIE